MSDAEAIASLRQQHLDAFNRADADEMAKTVSTDVMVMPPNQPNVAGEQAVRSWWTVGFDTAESRIETSSQELEVAGDWAYDRFDWTMDTTPRGGGTATRDNGTAVWIWRRRPDGAWLLARAIWNSDNQTTGLWSGAAR